jgi:hypothetical protein
MVGKSRADEGGDVSPSADLAQLTKKTKAKRRTEKETERQSKNPIAGNGQNAADDEIDDLFDKLKAYPKKKQKTNQGQGKEEVGCFALFPCFCVIPADFNKNRHPY